MKKFLAVLLIVMMFSTITYGASIEDQDVYYKSEHYLEGPITLGFDDYGYNYQAHIFKGYYVNAYLGGDGYPAYDGDTEQYFIDNEQYFIDNPTKVVTEHWAWAYRDIILTMKWNDAWLANFDKNDDGELDRHDGYDSYIGSGAWLTNHMSYGYDKGKKNNYFVKIVAVPADATLKPDGTWYTAGGEEIGPALWGAFAIIFEIEKYELINREFLNKSHVRSGLGDWY